MTLRARSLEDFPAAPQWIRDQLPLAAHRFAPESPTEMAEMLATASDDDLVVVPWGGGVHQGLGHRVTPDIIASTRRLDRIVAWEPEDLTVVVEAGVLVDDLEAELASRRQTAAFTETSPGATIGGVIAAGVSGYRRARYGTARDRILQATVATGDGRLVTAGGRVVKNVSGYDIQRSIFGAHGALGVVTSVCLKLWPRPAMAATVGVADPAAAWRSLYRPLAVLETETGSLAFLEGPARQVEDEVGRLGSNHREGLHWPSPPEGSVSASVTVPPSRVVETVDRVRSLGPFVAQHGVGRIDFAAEPDTDWHGLRAWAEEALGRLTITSAPDTFYDRVDPWGADPPALAVQQRLIAAFDPRRTINRGRLPGGV